MKDDSSNRSEKFLTVVRQTIFTNFEGRQNLTSGMSKHDTAADADHISNHL